MRFKSLFFAAFCLLTIAACHDHEHEDDANAPVVTLEAPLEGASISGPVNIHIKVTDEGLHEMEIKVTKDADGAELFKATPSVFDQTAYHFEESFTPTVTAETAVTLTAKVSDHNDNTTTKMVKFIVKP